MTAQPPLPSRSTLLAGRRVLVTGAAGSIGRAVADAVERHGGAAVPSDRLAAGGVLRLDVADEGSVEAGFVAAGAVTDVVHAAGALIVGPLADTALGSFQEAVAVNLTGAFLVGREAARRLPPGGTLTMIASQAGYRAGRNWGVYCAVKAGVMRLAEALAHELGGRGIRVNSVCPGSVDTPMSDEAARRLAAASGAAPAAIRARNEALIPLGRYAVPREIGDVCAFLASPLASYLSGAAIPVDGGEVSA